MLGLVVAAASLAVLMMTVRVALGSAVGQSRDASAMATVHTGRETQTALLSVLGLVSISLVVVVMAVCVGTALLRGRLRWAVGAVVVIAGANVTTQLLKRMVLDRPDLGLGTLNSLPSGHTTVVASATAATLLVAPRALRPVLVLGGAAATTLTGASTIAAGWHRPSDIVAALAVSLFWAAIVSVALSRRVVAVPASIPMALVGAAAGVIALAALGVRPTTGWDGFLGAAGVLGAVAAATATFTWAAALLAFDETPVPPDDVSRETSAIGVAGPPLTADRPGA